MTLSLNDKMLVARNTTDRLDFKLWMMQTAVVMFLVNADLINATISTTEPLDTAQLWVRPNLTNDPRGVPDILVYDDVGAAWVPANTNQDIVAAKNLGVNLSQAGVLFANADGYSIIAGDDIPVNYTPTHYTATSATIAGHIEGINSALGDLESTFNSYDTNLSNSEARVATMENNATEDQTGAELQALLDGLYGESWRRVGGVQSATV